MRHIKRGFWFLVIVVVFLIAAKLVSAGFGYGDVYRLDEETGQWVKDEEGSWASISRIEEGEDFSGNGGAISSITGTATVAFDGFPAEGFASLRAMNAYATANNVYEYFSDDGIFSITVTALPFDNPDLEDMIWDSSNNWFYLAHKNTYAQWRFVYKVRNNLNVKMHVLEVTDNFGGHLPIEEWQTRYSEEKVNRSGGQSPNGDTPHDYTGVVEIIDRGPSFGFFWTDFWLVPGATAEFELVLATGVNPGGKQQYNDCGIHELNSGGVLKYRYENMPGKGHVSVGDGPIKVKVCPPKPPSVCIDVSATEVHWFLRKPGDYCVKALDATVTVEGKGDVQVAVTFSDFGNLVSEDENNSQAIPVYYSLQEPTDSNWIEPDELNNSELMLEASAANPAAWSMWQRVVLGTQSVGEYSNTGVITFTLVNNQPAIYE